MKICSRCKRRQVLKDFHKMTASPDGHHSICKVCRRADAVTYMRKHGGRFYKAPRKKILDILGHVCTHCGFTDERALQIDHVHGGGGKKLRATSPVTHYREMLRDPLIKEKYQILCANCNWIKRSENDENGRIKQA